MTRRKRRQIFYLLVVLFFIVGTALVLYAQGWRFNIGTWSVSKVGGIFIRSLPDDARIFLNKKPIVNESAFLSRGTLISDLFPRTYWVELKEAGYDSWRESATVSPSFVTEFKYAVLVPQNATTAAESVQNFSVAHDTLVAQNWNGSVVSGTALIGKGTLIDESSDGNAVIIKNQTNGRYALYQFQNGSTTDLTAILANGGAGKSDVSNIFFDPHDPGTIIAAGLSKIWFIDEATMIAQGGSSSGGKAVQIEKTPIGEILGSAVAAGPSLIAWTESKKSGTSSTIVIYDKSSEGIIASSTVPGKNSELEWAKSNILSILQNDGELYLYDTGAQSITKIADDTKDFAATENGSSIAALENGSMEIIPTTGVSDDYYRFNLPDIADAQRVMWYKDAMHLFIEYGDHVSFLDLKDAGLNNFITVAIGTAPFYDSGENALYIVNPTENLIRFDFPK